MKYLISMYNNVIRKLENLESSLPLIARFLFAATLAGYFWSSAKTKLGDGFLGFLFPGDNAYFAIFPRAIEAAEYDSSQLNLIHWAVATAGTVAEFILPALIILGLFTRLSALGMIFFIMLQTLTDLWGHGKINEPSDVGAWFDKIPDSLILDQRAFWIFPLIYLAIKGAGGFSTDRLLKLH